MVLQRLLLLVLAVLISPNFFAQLVVTPSNNGAALVNAIVGTGVTVSGITMNCPNNAAGTFTGGTGNLQIPSGIVLTTGQAASVPGSAATLASTNNNGPGHALISDSQDACALTFTIVPTCNVLSIQFVFGSEEYPTFVGSSFNDAFGFFVNGPNPGGGTYNNYNMALIPGTATPISINNVNANTNSTYYINNTGGTLVTYNGLTTSITATVNVVPCESYTMTIVIADRGDGIYDSGVFLQSGGLNCSQNPVLTVSPNTVICSGESVTLTATGGTGHVWSPSAGLNTTTGTTVIASPTTTTTYTVTANVPCPATATSTVTVVNAINTTANLCVGETFDASIPLPTGGTITEMGGDRIHTFNAVGTNNFVVPNGFNGAIQYLIVAGGGGGGGPDTGGTNRTSGGGGGGGVRTGTTPVGTGTLPVVIGGGGAAGTTAGDRRGGIGGNSSFNGIISNGGGGGGASNWNGGNRQGHNGGSGGGAGQEGTAHAGTGMAGQGNNGGVASTSDGGGGGGAGAVGQSAAAGSQGGAGISSNISGALLWYGGGGAGSRSAGAAVAGGTGGGGNSAHTAAATNGTPNTGGGGGAGVRRSSTNYVAGAGGSGIVILRYARPIYVSDNPAVATVNANGLVTAVSNGTANITVSNLDLCYNVTLNVNNAIVPMFNNVGPYCQGAIIPALPTTSNNGVTGTWSPAINNTATTTYTFTPNAGQCASTTTMTVDITPGVTPTFNLVGPFCAGATIPALPTTSTNGITGTWSPAINNTATTTYTFTPSAGQCATTATMTITINPNITPTFNAVGPFCAGATIAALPTTSTNGITGTWSPAINNTATTTYTFTPNAGQCATTATMTITINPNITPTFNAVGPYCSGATIPALPTTSTNGITGTWSPAINNTTTTTYTFTPSAGQCATNTTLTITIASDITPTFNAVGPFCAGATIAALPTTSTNGITGAWSPAINNMATTTYTFTPDPGQCGTTTTMSITVNPIITPTFNAVGPFCAGAVINPLPTTSTNGITGTWSPAINNNATTTYTFTPSAGQCSVDVTMTIDITPGVTPTFNQVGPFCAGAVINPLPTTSTNGITGTWSPAINNNATTTYTFTPSAGQCATTASMTITINPNITPTFNAVGPFCAGAVINPLPTTSTNGITGTWSPAINNNATTTYTFTPSAGLCAMNTSMTITINASTQSNTTIQICENQLPYSWNGMLLTNSGVYTMTMLNSNGCDSLINLNLTVNPQPSVSFTANIEEGCAPIRVTFSSGNNDPNSICQWNLGNGVQLNNCGTFTTSYNTFGCHDVTLQVTSQNGCVSSLTQQNLVCVSPGPTAAFSVNPNVLSNLSSTANFYNHSNNHVSSIWNFGDGTAINNDENPQHTYPGTEGYYYATLIVIDEQGCTDTTIQLIIVQNEVIYFIPNTFTPDNDLFNQTFKPIFSSGLDIFNYNLLIFDRWGEVIFESNNVEVGWDGTYGGNIVQDGTYIWQITFKELGKDKRNVIRGHVNLLR